MRVSALALLLSGGTRVHHWQSARRLWPDTRGLQRLLDDCCRLVPLYNTVHSIQQTEQIPNDPLRMGSKSTTTSNYPGTPIQRGVKYGSTILRGYVWCFNKRSLSPKMVFIKENYLIKDFFLTKELTVHDIIYSVSYIITKVLGLQSSYVQKRCN